MRIFKNIAIKNRIKKNLKKRTNSLNGNKLQIQRVGCIVDIEEVSKVDFLKNFIKSYGINSENYVILGYDEKGDDIQIEGVPLFAWKDINYSGGYNKSITISTLGRLIESLIKSICLFVLNRRQKYNKKT